MGSVAGDAVRLSYPPTRRDDSVVDVYHGVQIPDPYRWLEDPDSDETKAFVEKQADLAESVLAGCGDREGLRREVTRLFDHPRHGAPFRRGNKYFHFHNSGLQAQSVLYVQDDLDGEAEVLLDPNTLSKDGTVSLSTYSISEDGKYFAYGLSESGSDWITIRVMHIADRQPTSDKLSWVKFSSISWTHDGKGFFYGRYPAPGVDLDAGTETNINLNHQIYYHVMGSDQSEDILCWKDPENPKYSLGASVTEDGKYIILVTYDGCDPVNKLYYCEISSLPQGIEGFKETKEMLPFVKLIDNFDAQYQVVANDGDEFTFLTNKNAPKNKLVRVNIKKPEVWTDVISEHERDVLESVDAVNGNQLVVCYMSDVKHTLQIRDLITGNLLHQLPLEIGSVSEISCRREDKEVFIGFTSFLSPGITYRCNLTSTIPEMKVFREISVPGFDRTGFEVKQGDKLEAGYSPLHNVRRPWEQSFGDNCQYPATMLLTADHDDRVVPLHSLKLLATLQHVLCTSIEDSPQTNPIIGRIDRKSGHGAGRPTKKLIDEAADRYSFMAKMLGTTWTE
uniref:Uncharacterized protein n=1 Tax=Avena sativa TaxID=4498 RepID=A0ACD5TCE2_AVESA